jgi:hypothetical protein
MRWQKKKGDQKGYQQKIILTLISISPSSVRRSAEGLRQVSGLLIRIMERGEPPPHPLFCSCKECLARLSELGIEH